MGQGESAPDLHGLWRSLVSALDWGSRGPGFKSRQPDGNGLLRACSSGSPVGERGPSEPGRTSSRKKTQGQDGQPGRSPALGGLQTGHSEGQRGGVPARPTEAPGPPGDPQTPSGAGGQPEGPRRRRGRLSHPVVRLGRSRHLAESYRLSWTKIRTFRTVPVKHGIVAGRTRRSRESKGARCALLRDRSKAPRIAPVIDAAIVRTLKHLAVRDAHGRSRPTPECSATTIPSKSR